MSDMLVILRCPSCGYQYHAATIRAGAWWAKGCTPANTAKQCYCPACQQPPPLIVVPQQDQMELFAIKAAS